MFKFETGVRVKDTITGYEGIISARTQWLHNCNTYGIRSTELKDGKPLELEYFDEPQLELIDEVKISEPNHSTGGPCDFVPKTNR